MKSLAKLLIFAALSAAACSRAPRASAAGGLSFEEFVNVMVELQLAQPHQAESILRKHKTDSTEIQAFIRTGSRDLPRLATAFDSIETRLNRGRLGADAPK